MDGTESLQSLLALFRRTRRTSGARGGFAYHGWFVGVTVWYCLAAVHPTGEFVNL